MPKSDDPTRRDSRHVDLERLIGSIIIALFVGGIAIGLFGTGPRWSEAMRWLCAGIALANMLVTIAAFNAVRRSRRQETIFQDEIDRTARQFADALEREMTARGYDGHVGIEKAPPPTTRH